MKQNAITVIVPIKKGQEDALGEFLEIIGNDISGRGQNKFVRFRESPSTHFARWAILRNNELTKTQKLGQRLYFSSNFDGDLDFYLKELVDVMGPGMEEIWNKCDGYTVGASQDVVQFTSFIEKYSVKNQAFYVGFPGATVQDKLNSIVIRKNLNRLLDSTEDRQTLTELVNQLSGGLQPSAAPSQSSAQQPDLAKLHGQPELKWPVRLLERIAGIKHGKTNPNARVEAHSDLTSIEDKAGVVQNQMTAITPIKLSPLARIILKIWLEIVVNKFAGCLSPPMTLNGITTIHFARWATIDNGKNLLFESNYDGSWEKYIDDFVDLSAFGMNMIWANCIGYPSGGCRDIESFKKYIRDSQLRTQVFYSAYPDETGLNTINDLSCSRAVKVLKRFASGNYAFP